MKDPSTTTTNVVCHQSVAPVYILNPNQANKTVKAEVKLTLDINKFNSLKDFSKELKGYCGKPKKKKRKTELACLPSSSYVPQDIIFSALQKCITNDEFWSKEGLEILLENNYIVPGIDDDVVFECIWKHKSFNSFKKLAKAYIVVPDKYVIKSLKNVIKMVPEDVVKSLHSKIYSTDGAIPEVVINVSRIMLLPVDKVTLKEYLKLLTVDEALLTLHCLHFILYTISPALAIRSIKKKPFDESITESKVVIWMDLILTAHLLVFTTSPTLNPLISEIQTSLGKLKFFYKDVARLGTYLRVLKERETLPKVIGEYEIETIKM